MKSSAKKGIQICGQGDAKYRRSVYHEDNQLDEELGQKVFYNQSFVMGG